MTLSQTKAAAHMRKTGQSGFTLIELMIAVAVIAILSAIAVPSYRNYVVKAKRSEARSAILDVAQLQERYFTNNNTYLAMAAQPTAPPAGWRNFVGNTAAGRTYDLTVTLPTTTTFTITAAPYATTFSDPFCGSLTLTHQGIRGKSGGTLSVDDCWR